VGKIVIVTKVVTSGAIVDITPPTGKVWKISALVATGQSFDVAFGDLSVHTGLLTNYHNLGCNFYISSGVRLVFENRSSRDRLAFCCGEEMNIPP